MLLFLLFYNKGRGNISRLLDEDFRHCDAITFDGFDYIWLSWTGKGIEARRIKARSSPRLLNALKGMLTLTAILTIDCPVRVKHNWRPLLITSCSELTRYSSGLDIGFTLTPKRLYSKVLKYSGKRNYEVLSAWRRDRYVMGRRRSFVGNAIERFIAKSDQGK